MFAKLRNAIAATLEHRRHPEDLDSGVLYIDALSQVFGRGDKTMLRNMRKSEVGSRLLDERQMILEVLVDRKRLRTLPPGSLGRAYVDFVDTNQIYPEKMAAAVAKARSASGGVVPNASDEVAYLHDRYRDLHDLWHVATGYQTDMAGELGLVGLQSKQTGYHAMAVSSLISAVFVALRGRPDVIGLWYRGRRRGKRAANLLTQDWEALLERPLVEVQQQLGLNPLPVYRPFHYEDSPATEH